MDRTCAILTYGCKVSQYEAQARREALEREGYRVVEPEAPAELYLLHTCTVTETAAREALSAARRIAARRPGARIRVSGCAAASHAAAFARIPGVEHVEGPRAGGAFPAEISRFDGHTRAFLKLQDGCDLACSFCIVPQVRGPSASRPIEDALDEARGLAAAGHPEIVLTGVHTGSFGKGTAGSALLPDLLSRMLAVPGLRRVRISSLEVHEVSDALLDLMAAEPWRVCPHLHLPLQSGDDGILRAMRRRYDAAQYLLAIDRIRARLPDPGLTTDVIVGFPGEGPEELARTVAVCERAGFHRLHVFPYSPRAGTEAARLRETVSPREKKARVRGMRALSTEWGRKFAERYVDREVEVLVERDGEGYTERYLPARIAPAPPPGTFVRVRPGGVRRGKLACP